MTSFDAVAWARRLFNVKKIGHCGTLDPDAAGVLPLCVGAATGASEYLSGSRKAYRVEALAGLLTDTLDTSGAIISLDGSKMPEIDRFLAVLSAFVGVNKQTPPMYSAIKVGGQKLYKLARKGVEATLTPRRIEIYSLTVAFYAKDRVIFDVECSKGTYVRALCRDLGEALGINLCMSFLLRTKSAGLCIDDALTIEKIEEMSAAGIAKSALIPTDAMFCDDPEVRLSDDQYKRYVNGADVMLHEAPVDGPRPHAGAGGAGGAGISADAQPTAPPVTPLVAPPTAPQTAPPATPLVAPPTAPLVALPIAPQTAPPVTPLVVSPVALGNEIRVRVYYSDVFLGLGTLTPLSTGNAVLHVMKFMFER